MLMPRHMTLFESIFGYGGRNKEHPMAETKIIKAVFGAAGG